MAKKTNTLIIAGVAAALFVAFWWMQKNNVTLRSVDWMTGVAILTVGGKSQTVKVGEGVPLSNGNSVVFENDRIFVSDRSGAIVKVLAQKI